MNSCSLLHMCFRALVYHRHNDSVTEITTLLHGMAEHKASFRYFWAQCKNEYCPKLTTQTVHNTEIKIVK